MASIINFSEAKEKKEKQQEFFEYLEEYNTREYNLNRQEEYAIKVYSKLNNNDLKELPSIWWCFFTFWIIGGIIILINFSKNPEFIKNNKIEIIFFFGITFLAGAIRTVLVFFEKWQLNQRAKKLKQKEDQFLYLFLLIPERKKLVKKFEKLQKNGGNLD